MNTFPNEILLEIFERMNYWDLTHTKNVSRRFRDLVEGGSRKLDKIRFIDAPSSPPATGGALEVHPAFRVIYYDAMKTVADIKVGRFTRSFKKPSQFKPPKFSTPLLEVQFANENATSPPQTSCAVTMGMATAMIEGSGKGGAISVKDVMEAFVGMEHELAKRFLFSRRTAPFKLRAKWYEGGSAELSGSLY